MSDFDIKGINRLLRKLNELDALKGQKAVDMVCDDVVKAIRGAATAISPAVGGMVGVCDNREGNLSYFVDIGLKKTTAPWEAWKHMYYHNYGYQDWGLGGRFHGMFIATHIHWFDDAVNSLKPIEKNIKGHLQDEIRRILNS